jgi:hypothetical protein
MRRTSNSVIPPVESGVRAGPVGRRIRQGSAPPDIDAQPFGLPDLTLIRVVVIDPYNQEIREAKMARGLFSLAAVDEVCLQFAGKINRTNELHMLYDGEGLHCFLIREINVYFGLGFVTGGRNAGGRLRSSRIPVAEVLSFVRFPDSFARESQG